MHLEKLTLMNKKKIVMFVFNHFENDSRVLKEATSLTEKGFSVELFAIWKEGLEQKEIINGFSVNRMVIKPLHKAIFGKSGLKFAKKILKRKPSDTISTTKVSTTTKFKRKQYSSFAFFINMVNKFFTYQSFYSSIKFKIKTDHDNFDIIHCHDMSTLHLGYKLGKKYKKPFIYDSHELFVERDKPYITPEWYKKRQIKFERKRIRKAAGVITVSQSIAKEFVKRYKIELPVLIYNTPYYNDPNQPISIREKLNLPADKKIVMYSGGYTIGRGLEYLVESLKFLPKNYHLILLGFGKPEFVSILNNIAKVNEVENQFDFYGPVPADEVSRYLSGADICVSPIQNVALNNYFSCPNKVFEYIQARVPLALSNFPELQRIIDEEKIGVTFNPEKPQNIAESITSFLNNETEYQIAKNNTEISAVKYNWEKEQLKIYSLYEKIMAQ